MSDQNGEVNGNGLDFDHETALAATDNYACGKEEALLSRDKSDQILKWVVIRTD